MFTGSGHVPYGLHDKLTEGVGGSNNGGTSNDTTIYYETVPSNYLESALWLESDRMGFLLDTLDLAKLNAQRDIVKNERRQGVDNQPYGKVGEILARATYPASNPYSWDVIGSMEDLGAASADDVKGFFRTYYAPNNAFLAIVGDFDPAQAKAWVAKYFGDIARGKPVVRPVVAPATLPAERRFHYEDGVQVSRLYLQWPTVGEKSDDSFALDVLGSILAGPRTARLTKALVFDQQAAASLSRLPGFERRRRRVLGGRHAAAGPHADRTRDRDRRDHREAEGRGADGRGGPEGDCRRRAELRAGPRIEPRQGDEPGDGRRFPRRRRLLQDGVPEVDVGHRRRRQARRRTST